ncbi:MAG: MltR family transcriptional regulator [Gammaproteobacteria bacterium]|nr:MltR family transcriptional regulator [Gammaproteobacteria bacterium]MBU2067932.1 MltR family transcriptional regulator [Gammaproteobacteria bacterium]MBU2157835.1 MltR family transcriptional regulator [Gammaproteobacteria bacterium]MBU2217401.1 MltR family transcriptional regulator [Gammaproteobacteria bacterium]MBU2324727.1 MltR family transcriptional regulator [Gammaproteobacteria bacterium]
MDLLTETFDVVWGVLKKESVRGSVIVACAILEDKLESVLKNRLTDCNEKSDYLFSGGNAPLGTMSAKIDLAYRTGCISEKVRSGLHIVRKLRNDFAHLSQEIDFDTETVKSRTENLLELNRAFVELIWGGVRKEIFSIAGIKNPPEYTDLLKDMIKYAGYRHMFEIWASALAGSLSELATEVQKLPEKNA